MHCTHQMAVNVGRGPQTAVALGGVTESRMPFYLAPNITVQTNRQEMEKKKRDKQKSEC